MSKFLKKLSAFVTVLAVLQAFLGCSNLIKPEKDKPGRVIINLSSSSRAAADISNLSDIDSFWCGIYSGAKLIAQAEDNNGVIAFEDIPEGTYRFDVKGFKNEVGEDGDGIPFIVHNLQIFGRTSQKVKAGNDNEISVALVMADTDEENLFYVINSSTLKSMAEASSGSGDSITLVLKGQTGVVQEYPEAGKTEYRHVFTLTDNVTVPVNVSLKMKTGVLCASGERILKFESGRSSSGIIVEESDEGSDSKEFVETSFGKTTSLESGGNSVSTGDKLLIDGGFNGKALNSAPLIKISGGNDVYAYENVEIRNCVSDCNGGAILVGPGSKFTLNGAVIHDNRARNGAGVYLAAVKSTSDGTTEMTMYDGIITDNHATANGGGVCSETGDGNTDGHFTMEGGAIFGNRAETGSNFYANSENEYCVIYDSEDKVDKYLNEENAPIIYDTEKIKVTRADGQKFLAVPLDTGVTASNLRLTYKGYEVASNAKIQEPYAGNSFGKMQVLVQANEEQFNVYIDVYLDPAKLLTMPKKDVWNSGTDKLEIGTGYDYNLSKEVNYYDNGNTGDAFQLFNGTCTYEWYKDSGYLENAGSSYMLTFDDKSSKATYKCVQTLTPVTSIVDTSAGSDGIDISRWFTSTEPVVLTYIWEPEDAGRGDSQQTGGTESGGTGTEQNEFNPSLMSVSYTATTIPTAQSSEQVLTGGLSFTYNGKETNVQNAELKIPADTFGSVPCTVTYTYSETEYTASVRVPVHVNLLPAPDADSKVLEEETITIIDKKVGDEFTLTPEVLTEKQACLFYAEDSDTAENLTLEYDVNCYWNDNVAPSPTYNDVILDSEEIDVSCNIIYKTADSLSSYAEYISNSEVTVKKTYKIIPVVIMAAPEVPAGGTTRTYMIYDNIGTTLRLCSSAAGMSFNPGLTADANAKFHLYKYKQATGWEKIDEFASSGYYCDNTEQSLKITIESGTNYYYICAYGAEEVFGNSELLTIICDEKYDDIIGSLVYGTNGTTPEGIVIDVDENNNSSKIMSYDGLSATYSWASSNSSRYSTSTVDGSGNYAALGSAESYTAMRIASEWEEYVTGYTGWYLPSKFEMIQLLLNAKHINEKVGETYGVFSGGYWSSSLAYDYSTEFDKVWYLGFDDEEVYCERSGYGETRYIRPIAKITN